MQLASSVMTRLGTIMTVISSCDFIKNLTVAYGLTHPSLV